MVELQEKLYKTVLREKELSTRVLNNNGLNARDINKLIELGELVRVKRGVYALPNVEKLYYYAKGLNRERRYEEAHEYFLKCYELGPKHGGVCFQLFFYDINNNNCESALKYVDTLLDVNNKYYANDIKYYLYLLSFIVELPRHLQKRVKDFTSEDFVVYFDDKRYMNFRENTKSRKIAFAQKFSKSMKVLNDLISSNGKAIQAELLEKNLLYKVIQKKKELTSKRLEYLQNKEYELLLRDLQKESFNHELSRGNQYLMLLLKDYLNIRNTSRIPACQDISADKLLDRDAIFWAMDYKNYRLALKLSNQYSVTEEQKKSNLIYLMLQDIVELMEKIEIKDKVAKQPLDSTLVFAEITNYLLDKNLDDAVSKLHNYLISIGKEKYEFLIVDLIKISILEKDNAFTKPMLALTNISKDDFTFDALSYVQTFYQNVSENNFEHARIYLDIITKSKDFGTSSELIESLNKMLELLDKKNSNMTENQQLDVVDITTDEDYIFLNEKFQHLNEKKGIIILEPMDRVQRKKIHKLVEQFPNMGSFSIGEDEERRIVLRYVNPEWIDLDGMKPVLDLALKTRNYKKCIECYQAIISMPKPKVSSFYKIGIYYNKLGLYSESIDYLTVAYELFSTNSRLRDDAAQMALLDLINKTKVKIEEQKNTQVVTTVTKPKEKPVTENNQVTNPNTKPTPKTSQPSNEYFGITKIDEISIMVNDMEIPITEACKKCGLTEEETTIVRLIYARDCYGQGNFEAGDKLFRIAERSQDKTPRVRKALEEVRIQKPFYMHREKKGKQLLKSLKFKN